MSSDLAESILKTVIYGDIFDYPLKLDELWRFWIGDKPIDKDEIKKSIKNIDPVSFDNKWFFIKAKSHLIKIRLEREKESKKKYKLVKRVIHYFTYLPSVLFVGISGALAMNNASKNDDIDLFVITKKNTLFTTRLLLILLLELLGLRRKRKDYYVSDKICLNMLIDETALNLAPQKQNLYCAHEVVQMVPVFEREYMYSKFTQANFWVKRFLPNALEQKPSLIKKEVGKDFFISIILNCILRIPAVELISRVMQMWSIKKHQTTEIISNNFLAFHPYDYKTKILSEYRKRLKLYAKI